MLKILKILESEKSNKISFDYTQVGYLVKYQNKRSILCAETLYNFDQLSTNEGSSAEPRNREVEAERACIRAVKRFGKN